VLQPLVVGLGRSGAGLHLRTLRRLARRTTAAGEPLVSFPAVGCDPRADRLSAGGTVGDITAVATLEQALAHVDPATTVVHLCTPPRQRLSLISELAGHGFRRLLVEKPLAASRPELDALVRLRDEAGLDLAVVSHWTTSRLAGRLRRLVRSRQLGALRHVTADQHKPRFLRSLTTDGHPTALDVEIPHSLGLVVDLAGPAELRAAHCWNLRCEDRELLQMGGAHVELKHHSGASTLLRSDLGAPVRQRSMVCDFEGGTVTAHFPLSEDDDHAQLIVAPDGCGQSAGAAHGAVGPDGTPKATHEVFRDDALTDFLERTYRGFAAGSGGGDFPLALDAARLLCEARERCAAAPAALAGSREHG
jgi:predicted dehydrogenase